MSGPSLASPGPEAPEASGAPEGWDAREMPLVTVLLQPEEKTVRLPRHKVKNVQRLLLALGIPPCTALVARGGELLTPDRATLPGDTLLVRKVTSSG